jgi:PIN domain nuclease of toxin-antitoxin system
MGCPQKMSLLLDTHIFLWWYLDHPKLSRKHRSLLANCEKKNQAICLSIISLWEIAKLISLGKFNISFSIDEWFEQILDDPLLEILPLSGRIILESTRLGKKFPRDPSDQLITATARCHSLTLVTKDERISNAKVVAIL